jgi:hypothetical protein
MAKKQTSTTKKVLPKVDKTKIEKFSKGGQVGTTKKK